MTWYDLVRLGMTWYELVRPLVQPWEVGTLGQGEPAGTTEGEGSAKHDIMRFGVRLAPSEKGGFLTPLWHNCFRGIWPLDRPPGVNKCISCISWSCQTFFWRFCTQNCVCCFFPSGP